MALMVFRSGQHVFTLEAKKKAKGSLELGELANLICLLERDRQFVSLLQTLSTGSERRKKTSGAHDQTQQS